MATVRGGTQGATLLGMARRNRPALLLGTALQAVAVMVLALPAGAQPAPGARPTGGQVVAGSALISQSAQTTTITQSTARAAVNWQKFDVGSQQTVRFAQPSVTASTLNRVTGPDPSQIAGRIQANGQVVLVNQSGVVFYKGAQVDVAGLVVSAAGITNRNYMAGTMKFDQPAHPNARIENRGTITIRQAGLAALVAPQVANSGVISAKLGRVVLAGAVTHTLDMYGDGLLSIDVSGEVRQAPIGPNGKAATALVTNSGTVIAEGGRVLLTARAADGIVQNLVDAGGRIAAPTAGGRTGMVAIQGVGGSIVVTGQLEAMGAAPGERGGRVVVNATDGVTLAAGSAVNASGHAGGGTVAIGTTLARATGGKSVTPRLTARKVTVAKGATIAADATGRGDGGRVTVLSSDSTDMAGAISAKGGPDGGNGGFVEVSGAAGFALTGGVDVSAPRGVLGTILLDPNDLDVVAEGEVGNVGTVGSANTLEATGTPATVTAGTLTELGATGNVELEASGTLGVHTNVSVANGLSLNAGGAMTVDPGVTIAAGAASTLGMTAGADLLIGKSATLMAGTINLDAADILAQGNVVAGVNATLRAAHTVAVSSLVQVGGTLTVIGQALTLLGGGSTLIAQGSTLGGTITPGLIQLQADAMSLAGGHVIADDGAVAIARLTTGTLSLDAAKVAGHLSLTQADLAAIQTIGSLGAGGGPLGTQTLVLGSLDGANASATTGRLEINAGMALGGIASTLSAFSAGDVVEQGAGAVSVNALTGAAPNGHIALNGTNSIVQIGNQATVGGVTTTGSFVAGLSGGTIDVTDDRDLTVVAPVIATPGSVAIAVHAGAGTLGTLTINSTIQADTTVGLSADQDIVNSDRVIAGTDASLSAGHDIDNDYFVHGGNDVTLSAGNDLNNYSWIDAGRDVHLGATNDINNYGSVTAARDGTLDAGGTLYNEAFESAGLIQVGNNATLHATNDIDNYGGSVIAGTDATLSAGNDFYSYGLIQAGNDVTLTAGHDIYNDYLIDAGRDVHLGATNDIDNNGSVVAGRDATLVAGNDINNYMQELGLAETDYLDAGSLITAGHDVTLQATRDINNDADIIAGRNATLTAGRTVEVSGTVQAGDGGTLTVVGQLLTLATDGSLLVHPIEPQGGGTIVPGLIRLQADAMSLAGGHVIADDGAVAIAPLTTGTLSLDAAKVAGHLSLTQADLDAIQTIGQLGVGNGPLGTQTLVLGSLDGASASKTTGRLEINTGISLAGIASTLSLFSAGDVVEQGAGAVSVNALTGAAPNGHIVLNGINTIAQIGGQATFGAFTTAGSFVAGLSGGTIDVTNYGDLTVAAPVIAAPGSVTIAVHAGAGTLGTLTIDSTVQADTTVGLSADQDIYNDGSLIAGTDATLGAGGDIENDNFIHADNDVALTAGGISNGYVIDAGRDVHLGATNDIDNYGGITAARDGTLDAGGNLYNEEGEGGGGLIQVGNNATLHATNDIYNYGGTVIAGTDATLSAGNDIYNYGLVHADNDVTLTAGHDIYNDDLVDAGRDVHLGAKNDIDNYASIVAGRDATLVAGNDINNHMQEIGPLEADYVNPSSLITAGHDVTLQATHDIDNEADIVAGRNAMLTAGQTVAVSGTVQAGDGGTLTAIGQLLTLAPGGSLIVHPVEPKGGGTITPGLIRLQADAMSLAGGHVIADDGAVAIARLTTGTLSLDAATVAGHLSLTQADLDAIQTIGSLGAGNGPLGTQTLVLGSLDGASANKTTGRLEINTGISLAGIASTLSLLSTGDVVEQGAGAVSANALTGAAPNGHFQLGGANDVAQIGNRATLGAFTTAGTFVAGLSAGTIDLTNYGDLAVIAPAIASQGSVAIAVHANSATPGTLNNAATIQANTTVSLSADQDIDNTGSVLAGTDASLAAGHDVINAGIVRVSNDVALSATNDVTNHDLVDAGRNARLRANRDIANDGVVGAGTDAVLAAGRDIINGGSVGAGQNTSLGAGGDIATTGTVTAGTDAGLTATHDITTDGVVHGGNDVTLSAGNNVTISGSVDAGRNASLGAGGDIATAGTVTAGTDAGLTAKHDITNNGTMHGGNDATLSAGNDITNSGSVDAVQAVLLQAGRNIVTMGGVAAGTDANLIAGQDITNGGAVHGGNSASLMAGNDISNAGSVGAGGDANLGALRDITNNGLVDAGNDASLASERNIANAGVVHGGNDATLNASSNIANAGWVAAGVDARLLAGGAIGDSGTVTAGHNATLAAGTDIVQTGGAILAGTEMTGVVTLAASGSITQTAGVIATQPSGGGDLVSLTAGTGTIALGGTLSASRVVLSASGDIEETGAIAAGLLSGNAGIAPTVELPNGALGSANLTGANRIATLGEFATTGSLTLVDGQELTIAGPVTTGAIAAGNPQVGGRTFGATIGVPTDSITVAGSLTSGVAAPGAPAGLVLAGGDIALSAGGAILIPGAIEAAGGANGGGTLTTRAGSAINETGAVSAVVLTGSAGGAANFAGAGATANNIQSLGAFTAGDLALTTGRDLAVSGPVTANAGSVALTAHAGHGTAGMLTSNAAIAATGSVLLMTDADMHAGGAVTAAQAVTLRSGSALATSGNIAAESDVTLDAGTDLIQTAGIVSAGGNAILGAGRDIVQAGGTIAAAGIASLTAGQSAPGGITLAGAVEAGAVRLSAPRDIVETGTIATALLTGNAGLAPSAAVPDGILGSATLTGAGNRIATLGSFLTTGNLTLVDGQALTIAGPVTTGAIAAGNTDVAGRIFGATIAAPEITVAGELTAGLPAPGGSAGTAGGDVVLTASGQIELAGLVAAQSGSNGGGGFVVNSGAGLHQSAGGVLAGALSGTAGGSVSLDAGANRIASIGDFTVYPPATGSFRLTDTGNVRLGGTLTSHLIVIDDRAGQIIFDNGAAIVTGGRAQPAGAFQAPVEADGGAFLTDFVQFGRSTVSGMNGNPATLVINALGQGSIVFDRSSLTSGLYGPNTWLVLTLGDPGGTAGLGQARGNVFVRWLDVEFHGTGGSADLGGTIGTLSGAVAAGSAGISPRADSNYRFNSCPIHSVHCVVLAVEGLPPRSPLQDISIEVLGDGDSDNDLLLPIVSDRDYTLTDGKSDQDVLLPIVSHRDY